MRDEFKNPITKAVHLLVEGICNHRASLRIDEAESDTCLAITIYPHANDARLLVGKGGRVIKALEWLGEKAGEIAGKRCFIGLEDSFNGQVEEDRPMVGDPNFDFDAFKRLFNTWLTIVFPEAPGMLFVQSNGEIKVTLLAKQKRPDEILVNRALDSVFFQYGMSNGCIVRVRPTNNGD